ncbi:MAG: leucine-rich repeat protein [Clostridia bacterium]|nr:leucine-rich repeat protein [Clostridia bacterium]
MRERSVFRPVRLLLMITVLCLGLPLCASAVETGTCGEHLTWTLADNGVLTIAGFGEMDDWTAAPWPDPAAVTRVAFMGEPGQVTTMTDLGEETVVESYDGITSIGDHAFDGCLALTAVEIPDTVTRIGASAFAGCSSLAAAVIPDSVTELGSGCFSGCGALASAHIPGGITVLPSALFMGCASLTGVDFPASLQTIGGNAFADCVGLTSVTLPSGTLSIGKSAFMYCTGLTHVSFGGSLTDIGEMAFYGCSSLKTVALPATLGTIGYGAFRNCGVTDIFFDGTAEELQAVTGKENLQGATVHCNLGNALILPDQTEVIGAQAFRNLPEVPAIHIPAGVTSIAADAFDPDVILFFPAGSGWLQWAADNGYTAFGE